MNELYNMIYKRKSIRKFDSNLSVSDVEMDAIKNQIKNLNPLISDIKTKFEVVKRSETSAKFGEHSLLVYSEKKENYLTNVGYMLEQMDLFMATMNIGACWYGMAKPKVDVGEGLGYIIMLIFGKSKDSDFRQDFSKCKRKSQSEIFKGDFDEKVLDLLRYAPSAMNSQPWKASFENNKITVYRDAKAKSIIPFVTLTYYNSVDMGIFLCFLEILLSENGYKFERSISSDINKNKEELIEVANYKI